MKTTFTLILAAILTMTLPLCAQTISPSEPAQKSGGATPDLGKSDLSLVGVGAVLSSEDGYAKVMEIIPGGSAQKEGHLQVGDRISAVAQGDADFVNVIGMKLAALVDLIRGKKGTTVRLIILRANAADFPPEKVIVIVRDEVKLNEQH